MDFKRKFVESNIVNTLSYDQMTVSGQMTISCSDYFIMIWIKQRTRLNDANSITHLDTY